MIILAFFLAYFSLFFNVSMIVASKIDPFHQFLTQTIKSSPCTIHLLWSPTTIRKWDQPTLYNVPVQITYTETLNKEQNYTFSDDSYIETSDVQDFNNYQSKFIKPCRHRYNSRCHTFLLLWSYPLDFDNEDFVSVNLVRLGFYNRIENKEYVGTDKIYFPTSYLGRLYFIFVLDAKSKLNLEDKFFLESEKTEWINQSFLFIPNNGEFYGMTKYTNYMSYQKLHGFTKSTMDTYLTQKSHLSKMYCSGEQLLSATYFVPAISKSGKKYPLLCSSHAPTMFPLIQTSHTGIIFIFSNADLF